jgi:hypothetical protein
MQIEYVIRTQSDRAYSYGLGEVVISGVTLFRAGDNWKNYDMSWEEVQAKLDKIKKAH